MRQSMCRVRSRDAEPPGDEYNVCGCPLLRVSLSAEVHLEDCGLKAGEFEFAAGWCRGHGRGSLWLSVSSQDAPGRRQTIACGAWSCACD